MDRAKGVKNTPEALKWQRLVGLNFPETNVRWKEKGERDMGRVGQMKGFFDVRLE